MVLKTLLTHISFLALGTALMGQGQLLERETSKPLEQETKVLIPSRIGEK